MALASKQRLQAFLVVRTLTDLTEFRRTFSRADVRMRNPRSSVPLFRFFSSSKSVSPVFGFHSPACVL